MQKNDPENHQEAQHGDAESHLIFYWHFTLPSIYDSGNRNSTEKESITDGLFDLHFRQENSRKMLFLLNIWLRNAAANPLLAHHQQDHRDSEAARTRGSLRENCLHFRQFMDPLSAGPVIR